MNRVVCIQARASHQEADEARPRQRCRSETHLVHAHTHTHTYTQLHTVTHIKHEFTCMRAGWTHRRCGTHQ
jgi:hypothetical protein